MPLRKLCVWDVCGFIDHVVVRAERGSNGKRKRNDSVTRNAMYGSTPEMEKDAPLAKAQLFGNEEKEQQQQAKRAQPQVRRNYFEKIVDECNDFVIVERVRSKIFCKRQSILVIKEEDALLAAAELLDSMVQRFKELIKEKQELECCGGEEWSCPHAASRVFAWLFHGCKMKTKLTVRVRPHPVTLPHDFAGPTLNNAGSALVGKSVVKSFTDFLNRGEIKSYDGTHYQIEYANGEKEDMNFSQVLAHHNQYVNWNLRRSGAMLSADWSQPTTLKFEASDLGCVRCTIKIFVDRAREDETGIVSRVFRTARAKLPLYTLRQQDSEPASDVFLPITCCQRVFVKYSRKDLEREAAQASSRSV